MYNGLSCADSLACFPSLLSDATIENLFHREAWQLFAHSGLSAQWIRPQPDVVRDVEFSYENKYIPCEKNKKDCSSGYRYDKKPSIKTVQTDRNESARDVAIDACMYAKGWRERTYYWPQW